MDAIATRDPRGEVRLRSGTRSRELDGRIAVSAGSSAVIVDGADAQALWTAIEPVLRAGVRPDRLLAAVPEHGRAVVAGILERLDAHQLLREVEPPTEPVPALDHLEAVTRRPAAAARLVASTTLRVRGAGPVVRSVVAHLGAAGYARVVEQPEPQQPEAQHPEAQQPQPQHPGPQHPTPRSSAGSVPATVPAPVPGLVLARVERQAADESWRPVAFAAGDARTVVVGPCDRDADERLEAAALERVARSGGHEPPGTTGDRSAPRPGVRPQGPGEDDEAPSAPEALLAELVGAQLALATLDSSAREVEPAPPAPAPRYLVTTSGLVSERRPHVALPRLGRDGRVLDVDAWATRDVPADPVALARLEPVWDPVLGAVGEPLPLDLPQSPVGLAALVDDEGRTLGGIGTTTAAARVDVVLDALRVPAGPAVHRAGSLGLGVAAAAARADAVARLVERSDLGWRPVPLDQLTLDAQASRLHTSLTRRLGVRVGVGLARSSSGLCRVDVRDADGELLGRAVATSPAAAAAGALLRAVGLAQWQSSQAALVTPDPVLDVLDTRSAPVRAEVDAWARAAVAAGAVQLVEPDRADGWGGVGVHAAVASWT
ncbi:hypothetical protein [Cellulomonas palmilytica]|uniref:hypothetical protein n=1 Tax=Cellulomonas palmilytica TaxID=2608402 RepID=UPI001F3DEEA5|nr:hypothetical protein [Cellulomonas palmilytica]UJP40523.1 hypothetical protein F1D97_03130 [Cellulomonas palmilytica]